jgi:hypothetical protein
MKTLDRRHWAFTVTFMVAYAILTGTDAASTLQGIDSGVAQEANPHVGGEPGAFELGRFLWINGAILLVLTACWSGASERGIASTRATSTGPDWRSGTGST